TMAATIGGVPRAAPMPVSPLSVSTRMSGASLLTLVPRAVRGRFSGGTGADIGMADTVTLFMPGSSWTGRRAPDPPPAAHRGQQRPVALLDDVALGEGRPRLHSE